MASDRQQHLQLGRSVATLSLAASILLAGVNLAAGFLGGSTAVQALGFEFLGDVIASSVVLIGIVAAGRPPDENHPYGHGRMETLAGLTVGLILTAGGGGICYRSLAGLSSPHTAPALHTLWALILAIVIRTFMARLKFRTGNAIQSGSLVADAWNDAVDVLSAVTALAAVGLTLYDPRRFGAADHFGGFAVGIFVIITGLRIIHSSSMELMDTMPSEAELTQIRNVALSVPGVLGVEKCLARKTGLHHHVDLHIEVDPDLTVRASHEIAGMVRSHIRQQLNWVADVLVHVEPSSTAPTHP